MMRTQLNDMQLGHDLPVAQRLLGKSNHVAGRVLAGELCSARAIRKRGRVDVVLLNCIVKPTVCLPCMWSACHMLKLAAAATA